VRALQKNPWQHRARLTLSRFHWSILGNPQLALLQLRDLVTMGRGKNGLFFNMYVKFSHESRPVSPLEKQLIHTIT